MGESRKASPARTETKVSQGKWNCFVYSLNRFGRPVFAARFRLLVVGLQLLGCMADARSVKERHAVRSPR
jgi:hypothetical protein